MRCWASLVVSCLVANTLAQEQLITLTVPGATPRNAVAQIAELTGGRVLDIANPQAADLFDRTGMPPSVSALPAWRTVLWCALFVMLLDVAARRLAWDVEMLRKLMAKAVARVAPAHVRGTEATATLATLRQVSSELDPQRAARAAQGARVREARRPKRPKVRPQATEAPQPPESSKVAAVLSSFLGRSKESPEESMTPPPDEPHDASSASETTRGLLAAKRRARKRLGADESDRRQDRDGEDSDVA